MIRTSKHNIICAVYSAVLAVIYQLIFCFASNMALQIILIIAVSALMLLPFIYNFRTVKNCVIDKVSRFIIYDLLLVIAPAAILSVVTEMILSPFSETSLAAGIASLILIGTVTLEALVFWFLYWITNKIY